MSVTTMHTNEWLSNVTRRDWQEVKETDVPIRFAMVGLGWWTIDEAIPAAAETVLCEPSVVVSGSPEKAEQVRAEHDLEAAITYEEFQEGEAEDAYDAVYIATPNDAHLAHVEAAAKNGKHVLCEKPMEVSTDRAQEMIDVCRTAGVTLMIAYRMHTEPVVRRAREIVQNGVLGDINHVHSHVSFKLLDMNPDTDQWKLNPEHGGGSMFGSGIYPLNTIRYLLDADPRAVNAIEWSPTEPFEAVDENTFFRLEFPDNIVAACSSSHNNYGVSNLRIVGTEGELNLDPIFHMWQPRKLRLAHDKMRTQFSVSEVNQMVEEFEYFAHCLLTDSRPYADGEHGLIDIEVINAVHESAETGEPQLL